MQPRKRQTEPFRRVQGPFKVLQQSGPEPIQMVQLPWDRLRGSQVTISVQDNLGVSSPGSYDGLFGQVAAIEVEIMGYVSGGLGISLRRAMLRQITGPLVHEFSDTDIFTAVSFNARCMRGGLRFPNNDPGVSAFAPGNGFSASVNLTIQRRGPLPVYEEDPQVSDV